jgi:hypothetical protein
MNAFDKAIQRIDDARDAATERLEAIVARLQGNVRSITALRSQCFCSWGLR